MKDKYKHMLMALVLTGIFFLGVRIHEIEDVSPREAIQTCFRNLEKDLEKNCPGVFKDGVVIDTTRYWLNKLLTDCRLESFEVCQERKCN
jgi:monoamine oxidase